MSVLMIIFEKKKRPGTGGAASFSVGWVKPEANAKKSITYLSIFK